MPSNQWFAGDINITKIIFSEEGNWDGNKGEVFFHAEIEGKGGLILCRVPSSILRDFFSTSSSEKKELMSTFSKQKSEIEQICQNLIQAQRYEEDGSILVQTQDLAR